eukprot:2364893-Rhodomonas_salina.1
MDGVLGGFGNLRQRWRIRHESRCLGPARRARPGTVQWRAAESSPSASRRTHSVSPTKITHSVSRTHTWDRIQSIIHTQSDTTTHRTPTHKHKERHTNTINTHNHTQSSRPSQTTPRSTATQVAGARACTSASSTRNVLWPAMMRSLAPMRVKMRSQQRSTQLLPGTNAPTCPQRAQITLSRSLARSPLRSLWPPELAGAVLEQ